MALTAPQDVDRINNMLNAVANTLGSLYLRWQDEREYEPIEDYKPPIEAILKRHGMQVVKMTKRPFGFHFTISETGPAVYSMFMNSSKYGWKRIA